jgi:hypothetical protein
MSSKKSVSMPIIFFPPTCKRICLLLALLLVAQRLPAQTQNDDHGPTFHRRNVSYAPLSLFTTGAGRIVPFEDGQMLQVGRNYVMAAIPQRGYVFANWQPVNVFTETITAVDDNGVTNTITSMVPSLVPPSSTRQVLRFTMQPEVLITNIPGVVTITESSGWQANFVPARRHGFGRDESRDEGSE